MSQVDSIKGGKNRWARSLILVILCLFVSLSISTPANAAPTTPTTAPAATAADEEDEGFIDGIISDALGGIATLFGEAVTTALGATLGMVVNSSTVEVWTDCNAGSVGCWFQSQFDLMKTIGVAIIAPMALLSIIQAITKGSLFQIVKSIGIFLPIAFLGTAVAAQMVQLLLQITDDFSAVFLNSSQSSLGTLQENISSFYATGGDSGTVTSFVLIFLAIPLLLACVFVWLILVLRSASIYLATLFLPIGFAMLIWPAAARNFKRLAQFLIAMILSKLVMVAGISLAMASLAAIGTDPSVPNIALDGTAVDTAGAATGAGALDSNALNQIILFTAMMIVICFAPTTLMKFLDNFSLQEAAGALNSHTQRLSLVSQIIFASRVGGIKGSINRTRQANEKARQLQKTASSQSPLDVSMGTIGVNKKTQGGAYENGYEKTVGDVQNSTIDPGFHQQIVDLTHSNSPSDIFLGNVAFALGDDPNAKLVSINRKGPNDEYASVTRQITDPSTGITRTETALLSDLGDKVGGNMVRDDPAMARRAAGKAKASGTDRVVFITGNPQQTRPQQERARQMADGGRGAYGTITSATGAGGLNDQMRTVGV